MPQRTSARLAGRAEREKSPTWLAARSIDGQDWAVLVGRRSWRRASPPPLPLAGPFSAPLCGPPAYANNKQAGANSRHLGQCQQQRPGAGDMRRNLTGRQRPPEWCSWQSLAGIASGQEADQSRLKTMISARRLLVDANWSDAHPLESLFTGPPVRPSVCPSVCWGEQFCNPFAGVCRIRQSRATFCGSHQMLPHARRDTIRARPSLFTFGACLLALRTRSVRTI